MAIYAVLLCFLEMLFLGNYQSGVSSATSIRGLDNSRRFNFFNLPPGHFVNMFSNHRVLILLVDEEYTIARNAIVDS